MTQQFAWILASRVLAAIFQILQLALLARNVAPGSLGVVAAVLGAIVIPQTLFDLGVATFVIKHRSESGAPSLLARALRLNAITSSLLAGFLGVVLLACAWLYEDMFLLMLLPLALWAAIEKNTDVWLGMSLADGNARFNAIVILLRRLTALLAMVVLIYVNVDPVFAFCTSMLSGAAISMWITRRTLTKQSSPLDSPVGFTELFSLTKHFWVHSVATQLRNLDTLIVAMFVGASQAGFYGLGSRLTGPLRLLPTSLASVVLPAVARQGGRLGRRNFIAICAVLVSTGVFFFLVAFFASSLVGPVFGAEYQPAVPVIHVLCVAFTFGAVASVLASLFQARGQAKIVGRSSVLASILGLATIAGGAISFDAVGAAWGLAITFIAQCALMLGLNAQKNSGAL